MIITIKMNDDSFAVVVAKLNEAITIGKKGTDASLTAVGMASDLIQTLGSISEGMAE